MFVFKDISIQNFRSLDDVNLVFDNNQISAITGDNGTGKSSLLYCIAFCLTGYKNCESYKDYVKIGTDEAHIHLNALFLNEPISYDITISSKSSVTKVVKYKGVEYLNSDYSQFIKEYELEDLESIMFMFQGSNDIIDARPGERAAMLKKLFKFQFDDIVESLKTQQEQNKLETAQNMGVMNELQSMSFETQPLLREKVDSAVIAWENELNKVNDSLIEIGNIDTNKIKEYDSLISSTEKNYIETKSRIDYYNSNIVSLESTIKQDKKSLIRSTDEIQIDIDKTKEKLAKHNIDYQKIKENYDTLIKSLSVNNYALSELNKQIEISKTGVCHACGQSIDENHVNKLIERKEQIDKELNNLRHDIDLLNYDSNDMAGLKIKDEISYYEKELSNYNSVLYKIESNESRLSELKESIKTFNDRLTELSNKKNDLIKEKEQLNSLIPLIEERDTLLNKKKELNDLLNEAKETKIKNSERRLYNKKIKEDRDNCLIKIQDLNNKINNLALEAADNKTIIDIFEKQFPNFMVLQACKQLEDYINIVVQKVFPYCKVALRLQRSGVSFYYTPENSNEEFLSVSCASGAQRQILSLAYKCALAKLYKVSSIFLDEIDAAMSESNAHKVYEFVGGLTGFDQIFFVSHRKGSLEAIKNLGLDNAVFYEVCDGNYNII